VTDMRSTARTNSRMVRHLSNQTIVLIQGITYWI